MNQHSLGNKTTWTGLWKGVMLWVKITCLKSLTHTQLLLSKIYWHLSRLTLGDGRVHQFITELTYSREIINHTLTFFGRCATKLCSLPIMFLYIIVFSSFFYMVKTEFFCPVFSCCSTVVQKVQSKALSTDMSYPQWVRQKSNLHLTFCFPFWLFTTCYNNSPNLLGCVEFLATDCVSSTPVLKTRSPPSAPSAVLVTLYSLNKDGAL